MGVLNVTPQTTHKWVITKKQVMKLIAAELGVPESELTFHFELVDDSTFDDRFSHYVFDKITVTSK